MKKRDLFVFCGQSNMMGAAVLPPKMHIAVSDSYEYKHKTRRLGASVGEFVTAGYPCGEFSYTDAVLKTAYSLENIDENGNSKLDRYSKNTYFCPAMCNLKNAENYEEHPFDSFSESSMVAGPSMAPMFASEWEKRGQSCAYAHIAKGSVSIMHYFDADMLEEYNYRITKYNEANATEFATVLTNTMWEGAASYFGKKVGDFFADAEKHFVGDDMRTKIFVWCQGESDATLCGFLYKMRLEILWKHLKKLGFTHFFCVRIGYWVVRGENKIHEIMEAQEQFCRENDNCHIITRAMSYMSHKAVDSNGWFVKEPLDEYRNCRDSYFGFKNPHINEKGFALVAKRMADNAVRILRDGNDPILEEENVAKIIADMRK